MSSVRSCWMSQRAPGWQDQDLGIQIERRLGSSYHVYLKLVGRLQKAILKFATKLGLDPDHGFEPSWIEEYGQIEKHTLDRFFRKSNRLWGGVMLGFDSKKVDGLLEQIEKDIMRIDGLTSENIKLEVLRQERQQKSAAIYWRTIRDRARRLFETLSSKWSCQCECEKTHCASLKLEVRNGGNASNAIAIRFGVLFSYDDTSSLLTTTTSAITWQDVEIETIECKPAGVTKIITSGHSRPAKKAVGFSLSSPNSKSTTSPQNGQAGNAAQCSSSAAATTRAARIWSLCSIMSQTYRNAVCIGYLDDDPWQQHIYSARAHNTKRSEPVSLYETLGLGLGTKEKYKIALTLASTMLQLSTTPWLKESLGIRDIHFHPEDPNTFGNPYISRSFNPNPDQSSTPISESRSWVRNEAIFGLGVLLIELSYGRPLLSYATEKDLYEGKEAYFTKHEVATRLAKGISQREPEKYANAVTRCVHCAFSAIPDMDNAALQEEFLNNVVQPLQDLCNVLS